MSQFACLQREWGSAFEAASKADDAVYGDPRTARFYGRRVLELSVNGLYTHDSALRLPYQDSLPMLIHQPSLKQMPGEAVFNKARMMITRGAVRGEL
jgi:type I restriction enzyme, R subunit